LFGLSRKERYERKVEVALIALLADFVKDTDNISLLKGIKEIYSEHWDGVIEEGIELKNSPELTALMICVIFYQDMLRNHCSKNDIEYIRKCIIEDINDSDDEPSIVFKMKMTVLLANGWAGKEITQDQCALAIRDIHRAIFDGDDEYLDDTVTYLIEGVNRIKAQVRQGIPSPT